jgi:hypothetical protein
LTVGIAWIKADKGAGFIFEDTAPLSAPLSAKINPAPLSGTFIPAPLSPPRDADSAASVEAVMQMLSQPSP